MSSESSAVHLAPLDGGIARLSIVRPPVNVLGSAELEAIARRVHEASSARALVLTGSSDAFSAGVDVAEHAPEPARIERMLGAMRSLLEALLATPAATIAAVNGACLGGAAEIAAACDLVVVAEDARIGFPEIRLACFPPAALGLLPLRIGEARAVDWILTGRVVSGREAFAAGFANRCVASERVDEEGERLARELAARAPAAFHAALELARGPRRRAIAQELLRAEDAYRRLAGDRDLDRAVREFLGHRR